jgi:hypothetical protein
MGISNALFENTTISIIQSLLGALLTVKTCGLWGGWENQIGFELKISRSSAFYNLAPLLET